MKKRTVLIKEVPLRLGLKHYLIEIFEKKFRKVCHRSQTNVLLFSPQCELHLPLPFSHFLFGFEVLCPLHCLRINPLSTVNSFLPDHVTSVCSAQETDGSNVKVILIGQYNKISRSKLKQSMEGNLQHFQ